MLICLWLVARLWANTPVGCGIQVLVGPSIAGRWHFGRKLAKLAGEQHPAMMPGVDKVLRKGGGLAMSDVRIVKLEAADLSTFKAIRLESLAQAPKAFANTEADWSSLPDEEWLDRMKNPVFVMFRKQEPIGVMGLLRQRGSKTLHRARLIMVYLREDARGQGLADALLKSVVAFAKEEGVRQLELNVSDHNAQAINFYKRFGFERVGRIPSALIDDGIEVDELIMVCRLT
jgi:ribosomal protein S18 acetylase RimI-like enzyme